MSFKIRDFLASLGGNAQIASNPIGTPPLVASSTAQDADEYIGGIISVSILPSDEQRDVILRAIEAHAINAGLSTEVDPKTGKSPAREFAERWTGDGIYKQANGQDKLLSNTEFAALKATGKFEMTLSLEHDSGILADLNRRVANNKVNSASAYTTDERTALLQQQKGGGQSHAAIMAKPMAIMASVNADGGKIKNETDALTRYIEQNYNPDGRVWGDKINETVSLAKQQGVQIENLELMTDEDGRQHANFTLSQANKQKLDRLFNQALDEAMKGEQASIKGQQEATNQVGDIGRMYANGVINTVNHATEPARGTLKTLGVDTSAAKLPKLEYQSEYGKKNGVAGELGTEIGIAAVTAPHLLKTTAGKVVTGVSGAYNVGAGLAGADPTEAGETTKYREMNVLERGMRVVGGAAEIVGAKPTFGATTTSKAGTTAPTQQTDEVVEALTTNGRVVKVQVPRSAEVASEAATAKPTQTAEDLNAQMRYNGRGGYVTEKAYTKVGIKMPRVRQPEEVSPSMKPSEANQPFGEAERIPKGADERLTRGLTRQNEAAETLAKNGYKVEQKPQLTEIDRMSNPWLNKNKKPDFKIEGEIFDVYSPDKGTNVDNIRRGINSKVEAGQTRRVVLDMDDTTVSLDDLKEVIWQNPIVELEQILIIKDGKVTKFFPFSN